MLLYIALPVLYPMRPISSMTPRRNALIHGQIHIKCYLLSIAAGFEHDPLTEACVRDCCSSKHSHSPHSDQSAQVQVVSHEHACGGHGAWGKWLICSEVFTPYPRETIMALPWREIFRLRDTRRSRILHLTLSPFWRSHRATSRTMAAISSWECCRPPCMRRPGTWYRRHRTCRTWARVSLQLV